MSGAVQMVGGRGMKVAELRELLVGIPDHADVVVELESRYECGGEVELVSVVDAQRFNISGAALALQLARDWLLAMPILPASVDTKAEQDLAAHLISRMQHDPRLAYLIGPGSQTFELLGDLAQEADKADQFREMETHLKFEPWPDTSDLVDAIETLLGISEASTYMPQKEREQLAQRALNAQAQR